MSHSLKLVSRSRLNAAKHGNHIVHALGQGIGVMTLRSNRVCPVILRAGYAGDFGVKDSGDLCFHFVYLLPGRCAPMG